MQYQLKIEEARLYAETPTVSGSIGEDALVICVLSMRGHSGKLRLPPNLLRARSALPCALFTRSGAHT